MSDLLTTTGATFSACRRYRYKLWRIWDITKPPVVFVLMNPSTADEIVNDPTIERCVRRVLRWKEQCEVQKRLGPEPPLADFGGVVIVNVFAWRETDSRLLACRITEGFDIIGPDNDLAIRQSCQTAGMVICGWGKPGHNLLERGPAVIKLLTDNRITHYALDLNEDTSPKHPLYIGYDVMPWQVYP